MEASVAVLPGDGVGPEVTFAAQNILKNAAEKLSYRIHFEEYDFGGMAIDRHGNPLPLETFDACQAADAVLVGAVGGPKWDDPRLLRRPEQGLLNLRAGLKVYANLRRIRLYPCLEDQLIIKPEFLGKVDILLIRELTGGVYFGAPTYREDLPGGGERAVDTIEYTDSEIRRVAKIAFQQAAQRRGKVTSVDKANILESSRLWRKVVTETASLYSGVVLEHRLVDSAALRIIREAHSFDVIVTENLFGDILSNEAANIAGSIGLLPSASLGDGKRGIYEAVHGSAPDIAGKGIANPIGAILSGAMLARYSLGWEDVAVLIEEAVERALQKGIRTQELGGTASTHEMTTAIKMELEL